jgi:hypothetical protein
MGISYPALGNMTKTYRPSLSHQHLVTLLMMCWKALQKMKE